MDISHGVSGINTHTAASATANTDFGQHNRLDHSDTRVPGDRIEFALLFGRCEVRLTKDSQKLSQTITE